MDGKMESSMEEEEKGEFKIINVTSLEDIQDKTVKVLPESDLTIQTDTHLIQFEYDDPDDRKRIVTINTGCYTIEDTSMGVVLDKFELKKYELLESIDNTSVIMNEADKFFDKLDIYKKLKREPKRALLLASPPGVGKTAAINKVCEKFLADKSTAVLIWDTSVVRSGTVNRFFLNSSRFDKKVKRMILIMEDIGGGSTEDYHGPRGADSSLLNLLDGVGSPFKGVPTFIIATTNNPENSVEALIDRPGRFDKVVLMDTPNEAECVELLKFIAGKKLTEDDKQAAKLSAKNKFSIAHLQEAVVRSLLDDITVLEATQQLIKHKKKYQKAFSDTKAMGLGLK